MLSPIERGKSSSGRGDEREIWPEGWRAVAAFAAAKRKKANFMVVVMG